MKRFTKKDAIFFLILAVCLAGMFLTRYLFFRTPGDLVTVEVDGTEFGTYPLSEDREIEIKNSMKKTTNILRIEGGKAKMIEAECPDHLCMKQAAVSKEGETIVCLPNKVVVTVHSKKERELDAVAR